MISFSSRNYHSINDLLQMQELLMEARSQSDDWRYAHIGDLVFRFLTVSRHFNPYEFIRLWQAGDKLVGYAILGEDPSIDWQVLPEYEWRGIEEEVMAWVEGRLAELSDSNPDGWGGRLVSGARQDNPQRRAFLVQQGFQPGGQFSEVNLVCALSGPLGGPLGGSLGEGTGDALVEAPIPDGFEVRELAETEIAKRAEAHRAVWLPWTDGNISDDDYAYFMKLPGYRRDLDVVAVAPDGTIAAFVNGWIDPRNRIGDFGPVGACPRYRRLGLTRAVLLECLRRMQRLGMERVIVSTGVSNTPAICLYESVGFRVVNQYIEYIKMN